MVHGYGVIGCGYVGTAVAMRMKRAGHAVTATTRSSENVHELRRLMDDVQQLDITDPNLDLSFLADLEGLLISVAPTRQNQSYGDVFAQGMRNLAGALRRRTSTQPLHITYISSVSVYGDQQGREVTEHASVDSSSAVNGMLAAAEELMLDIDRPDTAICVLRLGGIYGPGRDMVAMIREAAGQQVPKNGNAINAWSGLVDIARGVQFVSERKLTGIYNLVDDMQLSRRELSTLICDEEGLPPVLWSHGSSANERSINARVSNQKLKDAGFELMSPSMLIPAVV
jgi:nucleoside-diphosphate-sugar epimerase